MVLALPSAVRAWDNLDIPAELRRPGVRLVVVEFYADWCKPCKAAVPQWNRLHERYKDRGLRLLVVSVGDGATCSNPGWQPDKVVCDFDGKLQTAFGADTLPQAFLYSWQGNLLVKNGHFEEVKKAVEAYYKSSPRILVGAPEDQDGKRVRNGAALRETVRTDLRRLAKFEMVASEKELASLRELRRKGHELNYDDAGRCQLGREVSANSELKVKLMSMGDERTLLLQLFSVESGCMLASSKARVGKGGLNGASFEAVGALVEQLIERKEQLPEDAQPRRLTEIEGEWKKAQAGAAQSALPAKDRIAFVQRFLARHSDGDPFWADALALIEAVRSECQTGGTVSRLRPEVVFVRERVEVGSVYASLFVDLNCVSIPQLMDEVTSAIESRAPLSSELTDLVQDKAGQEKLCRYLVGADDAPLVHSESLAQGLRDHILELVFSPAGQSSRGAVLAAPLGVFVEEAERAAAIVQKWRELVRWIQDSLPDEGASLGLVLSGLPSSGEGKAGESAVMHWMADRSPGRLIPLRLPGWEQVCITPLQSLSPGVAKQLATRCKLLDEDWSKVRAGLGNACWKGAPVFLLNLWERLDHEIFDFDRRLAGCLYRNLRLDVTELLSEITGADAADSKTSIGYLEEAISTLEVFLGRYSRYAPIAKYRGYLAEHLFALSHMYRAIEEAKNIRDSESYEARLDRYDQGLDPEKPGVPQVDLWHANQALDKLVAEFPEWPHVDAALYDLSFNLRQHEQLAESNEKLRMLLKQYPDSPFGTDAWMLLATNLHDLEKYREAAEAYKRVLAVPETEYALEALYRQGWCYFELFDYPKAVGAFLDLLDRVEAGEGGAVDSAALRSESVQAVASSLVDQDWNGDDLPDPDAGAARGLALLRREKSYELDILDAWLGVLLELCGRHEIVDVIDVQRELLRRIPPWDLNQPSMRARLVWAHLRLVEWSTQAEPRRVEWLASAVEENEQLQERYSPSSEWAEVNGGDAKVIQAAREATERVQADIAELVHAEARTLKAAGKPEDSSRMYELAEEAYRVYLERFPQGPRRQEFCRELVSVLRWGLGRTREADQLGKEKACELHR